MFLLMLLLIVEVNIWMWRFERAFPNKILVKDAKDMSRKRVQASRRKEQGGMKL
jgi:hypothetical protein